MPATPLSGDEPLRLQTLAQYELIGAPPNPGLQAVVELAARVCGTTHAAVNIITDREQLQLAAAGADPGACLRADAMCAVSIREAAPLLVPDARVDPRFAGSPWVTGAFGAVRCYAAAQLHAPNGQVLGTLCVFDERPRELSDEQGATLQQLARLAVDVLELRRHGVLLHQALREVAHAGGELARSNAALHHFATQVSHHLRDPLTGSPELGEMIDGILAHASVGGQLRLQPVALDDVVAQALHQLGPALRAAGATVTVDPLPLVAGDRAQLRLLLQNLIGNAVTFRRPDRDCRIRISGQDDDHAWIVRVADNGLGIPVEDRHRVLEMFTRLHPEIAGAGIGLTTCARIAAAHHGTLRLDGTPCGGTTVVLTLPRPPDPAAADRRLAPLAAGRS